MQPEAAKYLDDILKAGEEIQSFVKGRAFVDFRADGLLKAGVERKLEIIGEAMNGLDDTAPDVTGRITDFRDYISLRNRLIHGYTVIRDDLIWDTVCNDLPVLLAEVRKLLGN